MTPVQGLTGISFLSFAERCTMKVFEAEKIISSVASEILGRLVAFLFLSPAALLDFCFHSLLLLPSCLYAIGKSIILGKADFSIPWQHLERVRSTAIPILLGSLFGFIYPKAGIIISEPSRKWNTFSMLTANAGVGCSLRCSLIDSLSMVEAIGKKYRKGEKVFTDNHLCVVRSAAHFQTRLTSLQGQALIHHLTHFTLKILFYLYEIIENSSLSCFAKHSLARLSILLVPILATIDLLATLAIQTVLLILGSVRMITRRGPLYSEVMSNPLMQLGFTLQAILKWVGYIIGVTIGFVHPPLGLRVALLPSHLLFKAELALLRLEIGHKMRSLKEGSYFALPIFYAHQYDLSSLLSYDVIGGSHKTYLVIKKRGENFDLHWVDRPNIRSQTGVSKEHALHEIDDLFKLRFPIMDTDAIIERVPVSVDSLQNRFSQVQQSLEHQGGAQNCVASNLFGALEAVDQLENLGKEITTARYRAVRETLGEDYAFYQHDFFLSNSDSYSLDEHEWNKVAAALEKSI